MRKSKRILVCGASIAGPALAFWLHHHGFEVVVVEKAPSLRLGGQNIDITGAGKEVIERMGLTKAIRRRNTKEAGLKFVGEGGKEYATFPAGGEMSFTQDLEILRGDLAEILYEQTCKNVEYRFGVHVEKISEGPAAVKVSFSGGKKESFDLVIAADGIGSRTRELIFGKVPLKYLGIFTSYFTIPREEHDTRWAHWYSAPGGRMILLRPDNHGTIRASVNYWKEEPKRRADTKEAKVATLRRMLAGAGWEAERVREALLRADDVYLGPVSQVKAKRWWKGRSAMVGDAAYCPSPITGMGSTLAIVGAYVLAGELARAASHEDAFAAYEKRMRPYVEEAQSLPPGLVRLAYPQTKLGVKIFNRALGVVASKPAQRLLGLVKGKAGKDEAKGFELPDYDRILPKLKEA